MRVLRFPSQEPLPGRDAFLAELEAALEGDTQDPAAESWRQLRGDVRALAAPMDPGFAARLELELERRGALRRDEEPGREVAVAGGESRSPSLDAADEGPGDSHLGRQAASDRSRRRARRLASHRRAALGGSLATAAVLIIALVVAGQGGSGSRLAATSQGARKATTRHGEAGPSQAVRGEEAPPAAGAKSGKAAASSSGSSSSASSSSGSPSFLPVPVPSPAPGRVQQLGASITLATTESNVQRVSDEIGRIAVRFGGYVQSSSVQTQTQGVSEGTLSLHTPSAKLGGELAAIAQLAPVQAENQSLQDITNSYNSSRQRLSDAVAERQALLRALAAATSEGQVDSLRARLTEARNAINQAQNAFNAIARQAATAEVEVTVRGDARPASEGLTVHRGLRDAGKVLLITLTALLILAAVLIPLGLLAAGIGGAGRALRRHRRERALGGR